MGESGGPLGVEEVEKVYWRIVNTIPRPIRLGGISG